MSILALIVLGTITLFLTYMLLPNYSHVGNWSYLVASTHLNPHDFYTHIEELLKEREVPDVRTNTKIFEQGSILSKQRVYLEVRRGDYVFHICGAPWGTDFFFSWWLSNYDTNGDRMIRKIPIIGYLVDDKNAYYKHDTDAAFRTSVHQCVLDAIDRLTVATGIRPPTELERKPDLRSLLAGKV